MNTGGAYLKLLSVLFCREYLDLDLTVSQERAQEISTAAVNQLNRIATKLRSLFLVEDILESAKFAGLLYLLTYIGAWFNGLTLVILGECKCKLKL